MRIVYNDESLIPLLSLITLLQLAFDRKVMNIYVKHREDVHPLSADLDPKLVYDWLGVNDHDERVGIRFNEKEFGECSNINLNWNIDIGLNVHSSVLSGVIMDEVNEDVDFGLEDIHIKCHGRSVNKHGNNAKVQRI